VVIQKSSFIIMAFFKKFFDDLVAWFSSLFWKQEVNGLVILPKKL
jgi:hypothetical protein